MQKWVLNSIWGKESILVKLQNNKPGNLIDYQ
jgi:hypothetical protein